MAEIRRHVLYDTINGRNEFVMKTIFASASALALLSSAADASSVTFDFTKKWNGDAYERSSELRFEEGGITLDVTAALYNTPGSIDEPLVESDDLKVTRYEDYGLYVTYHGDNDHRIDGYYNELVKFQFDQDVVVHEITFGSILDQSMFDLFVDDEGVLTYAGNDDVETSVSLDLYTSLFGVGASQHGKRTTESCYQQKQYSWNRWRGHTFKGSKEVCHYEEEKYHSGFKITGLTVKHPEVVPLPAAGWMLLAGIGGLAALRRRKNA
jgi:hypothetical protein